MSEANRGFGGLGAQTQSGAQRSVIRGALGEIWLLLTVVAIREALERWKSSDQAALALIGSWGTAEQGCCANLSSAHL